MLALLSSTAVAAEDCTLKQVAQLPMVANDTGSPIVSILIDNQPRDVQIDTGGFWSLMDPEIASAYSVRNTDVKGRLGLNGIELGKVVKVPSVQVGVLKLNRVDFEVAPQNYLNVAATLGANWLHNFDVEIDPVGNTVALFSNEHCPANVIYWPHQDYAEAALRVELDKRITIPVVLNGKEIRALIDTGSSVTYLNARTASRLFDLTPDSPGAEPLNAGADKDGGGRKTFRFRFKSLAMGDITFGNPLLTVAPMSNDDSVDLIIGMHELRALHLYFAYKEGKLYMTTARGDIAARKAAEGDSGAPATPQPDPLDLVNASDQFRSVNAALARKDYDAALAALDQGLKFNPNYAPGYVTRGGVYFLKGDRDRALEDFSHAIQLDPRNQAALIARSALHASSGKLDLALDDANQAIQADPNSSKGYLTRGQLYAAKRRPDLAIQDLSDAMRLDPKNLMALAFRGRLYLKAGDRAQGVEDIDRAIQLAGEPINQDPKNFAAYMLRSNLHESIGEYEQAFADADQAARLQPKSAFALNSRCWSGAILGRLEGALADCTAALEAAPRSAEIIDSLAFVHFKAGRLDLALTNYTAALAINPREASSLYGRAMVKRRMGDVAGANADIAAAERIDPGIADHFGK